MEASAMPILSDDWQQTPYAFPRFPYGKLDHFAGCEGSQASLSLMQSACVFGELSMTEHLDLPKHDRLILAAGIPRSGSTWVFNAIRGVLSRSRRRVVGIWVDDLGKSNLSECDDLLVKIHTPDEFWTRRSSLTFTSHRDLRDIAASLQGMRWAATDEEVLAAVRSARRQHDYWAPRSIYDIPYESLILSPGPVAARIAELLGASLAESEIGDLVVELSGLAARPSAAKYDHVNLMHPGHRIDGRAGGWRDRLCPQLAAKIALAHCDWQARHGYAVE
jgi:hypothetical protein